MCMNSGRSAEFTAKELRMIVFDRCKKYVIWKRSNDLKQNDSQQCLIYCINRIS